MQDSSKSVVDILSATRNLLADPAHWMKGDWCDETGACCLSYAHNAAKGNERSRQIMVSAIFDLGFRGRCLDEYDGKLSSIPHMIFNDHADTTHADILAVLDRAIELAKAEEAT